MSAQYSQEQFDQDVAFFNRCCGRTIPTTQEEFDREVLMQQRLVQEELTETMMALINDDVVELLDGLIDVYYTMSWLTHILSKCVDKGFMVSQFLNIWLDCLPVNQIGVLFEEHVVLEAMQRVAVNNMSKFTADKEQAQRWAVGVDFVVAIEEAVVDDVTYYAIKDENGKIRKKADFVGVDLSDLV